MQEADHPEAPTRRFKPIWVATPDLQPGMVIADAVLGSAGGYATLKISPGGVISDETIVQLMVKGIECVAIVNAAPMSEADFALACSAHAARLQEIFSATSQPASLALLNALLARGPSQWQ